MRISDHAGEGTTKDWPAERGDLDLQHIYQRFDRGCWESGELLENNVRRIARSCLCLQRSSSRIFTLIVSYTNSTNLGAVVGLSW